MVPLTVFLLAARLAIPPPEGTTFEINGSVEHPITYKVADLESAFADQILEVAYTSRNETTKARCIKLLDLINAAVPKPCNARRNPLVGFVAVVQGDDGYTACFALGELLADNAGREVYIALDKNGGPLDPGDGPVRLIVPGDQRPSRWVFAIESITLIDGAAAVQANPTESPGQ